MGNAVTVGNPHVHPSSGCQAVSVLVDTAPCSRHLPAGSRPVTACSVSSRLQTRARQPLLPLRHDAGRSATSPEASVSGRPERGHGLTCVCCSTACGLAPRGRCCCISGATWGGHGHGSGASGSLPCLPLPCWGLSAGEVHAGLVLVPQALCLQLTPRRHLRALRRLWVSLCLGFPCTQPHGTASGLLRVKEVRARKPWQVVPARAAPTVLHRSFVGRPAPTLIMSVATQGLSSLPSSSGVSVSRALWGCCS